MSDRFDRPRLTSHERSAWQRAGSSATTLAFGNAGFRLAALHLTVFAQINEHNIIRGIVFTKAERHHDEATVAMDTGLKSDQLRHMTPRSLVVTDETIKNVRTRHILSTRIRHKKHDVIDFRINRQTIREHISPWI